MRRRIVIRARKTTLLLLVVVAAAGALHRSAGSVGPRQSAFDDIRSGEPSILPDAGDSIQAFYDSLAALEARIPAAAVELPALARRLGSDPQALLTFVADSIRYDHYEGVLRGAFGTLISRSGGSCDQAVFLREMLVAHGVESRLRVARADSLTNAALVERALGRAGRETPEALQAVRDSLAVEVERQLDHLTSVAPDFGRALAAPPQTPRIQRYCWVEADSGGQPVSLDPLGLSGSLGPSEVHDELPEDLRFRLTIRVVLEKGHAGSADSTLLATTSFATDTLRLDPIRVAILPERGELLDGLASLPDPMAALEQMEAFYPLVTFRETAHVAKGFTLAGESVEPGQEPALLDATPLGGRLGDLLGGGRLGTERDPPPADVVHATAPVTLRMTYETRSPDGRVETTRRDLARFAPPSSPAERARTIATIVQQKQLLVATHRVSGWYLARRFIDFFRENRAAVEYVVRLEAPPGEQAPELHPYPFQLLLLAMAEDGAAQRLDASGSRVVFRGTPEVLAHHQEFVPQQEGVTRVDAIDIVRGGFDAISPAGRHRALRARMGIYSSFLEVHMLGPRAESLLSIIRAARDRGGASLTLTGDAEPQLTALSLTNGQRTALVEELRSGRIVVTYERPVPHPQAPDLGWWRLDPHTGDVLAVLDNRRGGAQQGTEYTLVKATIVGAAVGAASGYSMCLLSTYQQEGWQGWQGRDGACLVAGYCGGLLGAVFAALIFARPIPVYMQVAPPYMAWSGPTQTVVAYLIPSWADIMASAGLVGGVGGGIWSNLACVIGGSGGFSPPPRAGTPPG